jgi:tRNA (cmo5U34)-methyltransferase
MEKQLSAPEEMDFFFTLRANGYDTHMSNDPLQAHWSYLLEQQFPFRDSPVRIIDLGCGTGFEIRPILSRLPRSHIICIDLSHAMLEQLKAKHSDVMEHLSLIEASYLDYDLKPFSFQYAVACSTMHHWTYGVKLDLYKRIHASLLPDGFYLIQDYMVSVEREAFLLAKYQELAFAGALADGKLYHIDIPFSVNTESRVLYEAGFHNVRVLGESYSDNWNSAMLLAEK